jgi:hypothetical protein
MAKKYERMEDLPPILQQLLKEKGWTYPPSEAMKRKWREARERFAGKTHIPLEALIEMAHEEGEWEKLRWYEEQLKKQQEKEKGGEDAR